MKVEGRRKKEEGLFCEVTLGEVAEPRREKVTPSEFPELPYIGLEHVEAHSMRLLGCTRAGEMASTANRFYCGDVLYSRLRPYLNKVIEADRDGLCSSEFIVFPPSKFLTSSFLKYRLNAADFVAFASSLNAGDRPRVDFFQISSFKFLLPSSLLQTRIVEKLEELFSDLDAGVAELKAAQKKLAQYRQSLLKAAVEGALTAEWRTKNKPKETGAQLLERILKERRARWEEKQLARFKEQGKTPPKGWQDKYPQPVQPDTTNLPELPEGWVWASLDQLSEFITSGSRGWADYYSSEGAIFIRSQNINKDWLDLSDIAFVQPPNNTEGARTRVKTNDLLLTITGANVGKTAQVTNQLEEAYVSQHVALIRLVVVELASYVHLLLISDAGGRGQLNNEAYGAGKPGLNLQQVATVSIPLPYMSELTELTTIIDMQFKAISDQSANILHSLAQAAAQRKNILKSAFSGQLVAQDPNDEPASLLLERIRAERQLNEKTGKSSSKAVKNQRKHVMHDTEAPNEAVTSY